MIQIRSITNQNESRRYDCKLCYLYRNNSIAKTYASAVAKGNITKLTIAAPRTNHGLTSKYFAMPAHTPDTFACAASLKNLFSFNTVFILHSNSNLNAPSDREQ